MNLNTKQPTRGAAIRSFIVLYLGYMLLFADRTVFNISLAGIGKEFAVTPAALGAAGSAFFLGYTIMQIPGGWLTDRFGARKTVIATLLLWSLLTVLTGAAWSLIALLVIRFLFGLAEGPYPAAAMKQVATDAPQTLRAQLTAVLISSNYAGAAIAPVLIVPIIAATGWRSSFYWLGAAGVVLTLVYLAVRRPPAAADGHPARAQKKIIWRDVDPRVWTFVVIGLALNVITKGLETWMPVYFLNARHINLKNLAWLVPLPTIAGGLAALSAGYIMVHLFKHRERLMIVLATALTLACMYGLFKSTSLAGVVTFQCLTYFTKSLAFTGIFSLIAQVLSEQSYGSSIGIVNFGGQLGGFVGPLLIGWLVQLSGSYSTAFLGLVCTALVALIASFFISNFKK